jgi:hypothetical protein
MEIRWDFRDVYKLADDIGAARDQVPYAFSRALNDGMFIGRDYLSETVWPQHVHAKNPRFPKAVLKVHRSDKHNLYAEIVEEVRGAASLQDHQSGGTRIAKNMFAIPMPWYKTLHETQSGLRVSARPAALIRKKKGIIVTDKGIYMLYGGKMRLAFVFKQQVQMKADVPFEEEFARIVSYVVDRDLPAALDMAMRTRFS